jgi:hypothetical protein
MRRGLKRAVEILWQSLAEESAQTDHDVHIAGKIEIEIDRIGGRTGRIHRHQLDEPRRGRCHKLNADVVEKIIGRRGNHHEFEVTGDDAGKRFINPCRIERFDLYAVHTGEILVALDRSRHEAEEIACVAEEGERAQPVW